ncbi:MAG: transporter [Frankiales bacterium]|nr:transporter [Frankiales bacterium]
MHFRHTAPVTAATEERASYREVLGHREFRAMFAAEVLSVVGDQVARIAVALLVFAHTGSAFAAAATYGCSFLTWLVGGPVLSTLADRYRRREVMIAADVSRFLLVCVMCIGGLPLWAFFVALAGVGLLTPPFEAARSALLADVVQGEQYVAANALMNVLAQGAQVAGYVLGGGLVALIGARGALAVDAATFALSALLLATSVARRPAPLTERLNLRLEMRAGAALVFGTPALWRLLAYAVLACAVLIVPEVLAVATAADLGRGSVTAGVLTAALPAGYVIGTTLLLRVPGARRDALLPRLVLLCVGPLVLSPLVSSPLLLTALWALAGTGAALQVVANSSFVALVPAALRGRAYGVASTLLMVGQGAAALAAGAVAERVGPRGAVAASALVAAGALAVLVAVEPRGRHSRNGRTRR